jgi:hypothetical protein
MQGVIFPELLSDWCMDKNVYPRTVKNPLSSISENVERFESSRLFKEIEPENRVTFKRLLEYDSSVPLIVYGKNSFLKNREFESRGVFKEASAIVKRIADESPESVESIDQTIIFPICMVSGIGYGKPLVSSSRICGDAYTILWPFLKEYRGISFGSLDKTDFTEKPNNKAVWRGVISPEDSGKDEVVRTVHTQMTKPSLLSFVALRTSGDFKWSGASKTVRDNVFADGYQTYPNTLDIALQGYSVFPGFKNPINSEIDVIVDKICQSTLYDYKFILCLEDSDVSMLLPFALASNCVPICPYPFIYESILFFNLTPWVHFIPVNRDFSNIGSIVEMINDPQNEMKFADIAICGKLHAAKIYEKHVRTKTMESIIRRWCL